MDNYIILISAIGTYFLAVAIHELGHFIPSLLFGYKPEMKFDDQNIPCAVVSHSDNFNKYHIIIVTASGIILGFIPLYYFYTSFNMSETQLYLILFGFMLLAYVLACRSDLSTLIFGREIICQKKLFDFEKN